MEQSTGRSLGLFWLLGYQLSPRLADIGDARFWRIDKSADYGPLNGLARNRINIDLVTRNWEDMLRLAGSLKLDCIHAGAIMRVLQVKDRPTTLARALTELGRIIKTLHMLGYIDSKEKRRRILTQLNRQEFRHRLAGAFATASAARSGRPTGTNRKSNSAPSA